MPEKKSQPDNEEMIMKSDLEEIIKVNSRAIEIQNIVAGQYEEIIEQDEKQEKTLERIEKDIAEVKKDIKELEKAQFRLSVLLGSGIVSLIIQLIMIFKK